MAKYLLGFALLLIAGTAYLGYETKVKVVALQADIKQTKQTLAATKDKLAKTEATLKATQEELETTKATLADREMQITKLKSDLEDTTKKLADATKALEDKTAEADKYAADLAKIQEAFKGINPEEIKAKVQDMEAQLAKNQTELAEMKQVNISLEASKKDTEGKLSSTQRVVQEYKQEISKPGLTGRVLAFNAGWNFVVLSIGDRAGLKNNAQMLVTRGGQPIAKVKVTTVEPATSIADVIPGTLAKGQSVQPGDTVVLELKR